MSLMDIGPVRYRLLLGFNLCNVCGGQEPLLGAMVEEGPSTSDLTNPCHGHAVMAAPTCTHEVLPLTAMIATRCRVCDQLAPYGEASK